MTTAELTDRVIDELSKAQGDALAGQIHPGAWVAIRINADGEVYRSIEASKCVSADEYYHRVPHNLTAWEFTAQPWNGSDDDCPVDEDGAWYDGPEIDDHARDEIEAKIVAWIEAGNLTTATA